MNHHLLTGGVGQLGTIQHYADAPNLDGATTWIKYQLWLKSQDSTTVQNSSLQTQINLTCWIQSSWQTAFEAKHRKYFTVCRVVWKKTLWQKRLASHFRVLIHVITLNQSWIKKKTMKSKQLFPLPSKSHGLYMFPYKCYGVLSNGRSQSSPTPPSVVQSCLPRELWLASSLVSICCLARVFFKRADGSWYANYWQHSVLAKWLYYDWGDPGSNPF